MLDFRLAQIFGIDKYDIDTGFPSGYLNNLCCLRDHYQAIMCSLFHVNEVERCQLTDVLECALGLIKKFETALMQEESSEPSQYVLIAAKCLFDYLASSHYIALIRQDGTRVTNAVDYYDVYSYGVYLTNNCSCQPELRYLIECGTEGFKLSISSNFSSPKPIPDNDVNGVSYILVLPEVRISSATNLTIWIDLTHTAVGDLKVTVMLPGGHIATVFDRPGVPSSTFGSDSELKGRYNFNPNFNSVLPETVMSLTIPVGDYQPSNTDGSPNLNWSNLPFPTNVLAGNWTLQISDNGVHKAGSLTQWGIIIS